MRGQSRGDPEGPGPDAIQVGIDVGGTFTDLVAFNPESRTLRLVKRLSTPADQTFGIIATLHALETDLSGIGPLKHGNTVALNTVLERRGARVGVITTAGFEDLLEIGKTNRLKLFDLNYEKPHLPIDRRLVAGVHERTLADGSVFAAPDPEEVRKTARDLVGRGAGAIAVCFINAYQNSENEERAVAAATEAAPALPVTLSSALTRELGEVERFSGTVLNAYVMASVLTYLSTLEAGLKEEGHHRPVYLMHSAGGLMTLDTARRLPVRTILSGPAAGVAAAQRLGTLAGIRDLITIDIGGTSCDVSLVRDGEALLRPNGELDGIQFYTPMLDVRSIGAGGGSIASVDGVGALRVGPESAGADPGPACYGRGGALPTVTDANLILGRQAESLDLGEATTLPLDRGAAERAVGEVAARLGISVVEAAGAIVALVETNMANLIRQIVLERGLDVSRFSLVGYGGAGAMHAAAVARLLGIRRVIVPPSPGNLCALGAMMTDLSAVARASVDVPLHELDPGAARSMVETLVGETMAQLRVAEATDAGIEHSLVCGMRFAGQVVSIDVRLPGLEVASREAESLFREAYLKTYGSIRSGQIEVSHMMVSSRIPNRLEWQVGAPRIAGPSQPRTREVHFGSWRTTAIFRRDELSSGTPLAGPALVEELGATTCLPPGQRLTVDDQGNLLIDTIPARDHLGAADRASRIA